MTTPSEGIRPPSKAALTFLRPTGGRPNGKEIFSLTMSLSCLDRCAASAAGILPQIDGSGHRLLVVRAAEAVG